MKLLKSDPLRTVLTIVIGLLVVKWLFSIPYLIEFIIILGLFSLFSNYLARLIEKGWFGLARILSFIVPNVLLTIIFFLLLFPVALLSRLFGNKDLLLLKNQTGTVYRVRNKLFSSDDFLHPW